ncbi:hypothetical protein D2Q93_13090 [Alicyclobacillaceae bacterium I2511]|nr:hypothetical protein D2Q93_13090 [Alicyclobacillaceae bacterium I2511]
MANVQIHCSRNEKSERVPVEQASSSADLVTWVAQHCLPAQENQLAPSQLLYYGWVPIPPHPHLVAVLKDLTTGRVEWQFAQPTRADKVPSLAALWPAASWTEREMWQSTGIEPIGHPDLRPILNPGEYLPEGMATGSGVFRFPLGPVRADVSESGFFLFETIGEQIMHLQPQLFYKHRGIEALGVGKSPADALLLAERISGTATVAHATAFCQAAEQAMQHTVAPQVIWERALWLEMERLYNHAHDLAQLASAAGMSVAQAQLARVKEELLRINGDLTGSRYLRGAVKLGADRPLDWRPLRDPLMGVLERVDRRFTHFTDLLRHTPTFVDRLVGTGRIRKNWVSAYGLVGPVARACGLAVDSRAEPGCWQPDGYHICLSTRGEGDALDRFEVRVLEWQVSVGVVRKLLARLGHDTPETKETGTEKQGTYPPPNARHNNATPPSGWGIGVVEGPRGRVCHVLQMTDLRLNDWHIKGASSWIWPVFGLAVANGNIQTDFPVIDASFGLSYAGTDR